MEKEITVAFHFWIELWDTFYIDESLVSREDVEVNEKERMKYILKEALRNENYEYKFH
jgi:6-phosphogluconolactonase/glucosamine-6-phosphate isomerase/deaminase